MTTRVKRETDWQDPIVAEVRAAREALFAAAGYDIREFCRRARAAQANSGHSVVTRRSRRVSRPEVSTMGSTRRRTKTG
jgi:predicted outer membrane protein